MSLAAQPESGEPWRAQVAQGVRDSLGVGIGIFPLGVALGILVVQAGLPLWVAPALSIVIFAGSVELLLVSMLAAGAPLLTIAVTVFAVNFRHVFYALSFPLSRVKPGLPRAYSVYALIDEAYATYVLMPARQLTSARILSGQVMMQLYWVGGGLIGLAIARALPAPIEGFEFALAATFTVMTVDAVRSKRQVPSALLAALASAVAIAAFPGNTMLAALVIFAALLAVRYAVEARLDREAHGPEATEGAPE
ncbi:AzlC family ABC transporter permease [Leucobacter aridicollis]|uniref:AzlC family ABC transporter permease n=1 Tax=Leucobacter aridicollis TaxID=283878 RepID=UPI00210786C3|nr:AzlC family ABC transporter permease [Leucobacter aridicollis]UTX52226.1 AzlC family ABC transporter permease [Leucobacter aridicollis]